MRWDSDRFNLAAASWPPGPTLTTSPVPTSRCFNLAAASWPPGPVLLVVGGESSSRFNLAAASWPPGRRQHPRQHPHLLASIWRRPPGRRDPLLAQRCGRVHFCFNLAAASWPPGLPTAATGRRAGLSLQSGGGLLAAGTFSPKSAATRVPKLQSGGGLLAAGTRASPKSPDDDPEGFNLAAASWPPGHPGRSSCRIRRTCFNLAAASWPPGHPAGRRGLPRLRASIWRRPPGRRDPHPVVKSDHRNHASIWRRPPGRRDPVGQAEAP